MRRLSPSTLTAESSFSWRFTIRIRGAEGLGCSRLLGLYPSSQRTDTQEPPEAEMPELTGNKEGFEAAFQEAEDQLAVFRFWATW